MDTIQYRNHEIKIAIDEYPENPRTDWDGSLGTMLCFHNRYELGDKHDYTVDEALKIYTNTDTISLPLFLYDHSGITMKTTPFTCPWDSGQVGIIFVLKSRVKDEFGWKHLTQQRIDKIKEILNAEVELYDDYITGNVYEYSIDNGNFGGCCGFYGRDFEKNGLLEHAKSDIDIFLDRKRNLQLNLELSS